MAVAQSDGSITWKDSSDSNKRNKQTDNSRWTQVLKESDIESLPPEFQHLFVQRYRTKFLRVFLQVPNAVSVGTVTSAFSKGAEACGLPAVRDIDVISFDKEFREDGEEYLTNETLSHLFCIDIHTSQKRDVDIFLNSMKSSSTEGMLRWKLGELLKTNFNVGAKDENAGMFEPMLRATPRGKRLPSAFFRVLANQTLHCTPISYISPQVIVKLTLPNNLLPTECEAQSRLLDVLSQRLMKIWGFNGANKGQLSWTMGGKLACECEGRKRPSLPVSTSDVFCPQCRGAKDSQVILEANLDHYVTEVDCSFFAPSSSILIIRLSTSDVLTAVRLAMLLRPKEICQGRYSSLESETEKPRISNRHKLWNRILCGLFPDDLECNRLNWSRMSEWLKIGRKGTFGPWSHFIARIGGRCVKDRRSVSSSSLFRRGSHKMLCSSMASSNTPRLSNKILTVSGSPRKKSSSSLLLTDMRICQSPLAELLSNNETICLTPGGSSGHNDSDNIHYKTHKINNNNHKLNNSSNNNNKVSSSEESGNEHNTYSCGTVVALEEEIKAGLWKSDKTQWNNNESPKNSYNNLIEQHTITNLCSPSESLSCIWDWKPLSSYNNSPVNFNNNSQNNNNTVNDNNNVNTTQRDRSSSSLRSLLQKVTDNNNNNNINNNNDNNDNNNDIKSNKKIKLNKPTTEDIRTFKQHLDYFLQKFIGQNGCPNSVENHSLTMFTAAVDMLKSYAENCVKSEE